MPSYQFRCSDCPSSFTVNATIREAEEGAGSKFHCPSCGSGKTKRVFSLKNFLHNIFTPEKSGGCCDGGACCSPSPSTNDKCCSGGACRQKNPDPSSR